ncbi:hypothetical protein YC2023_097981 [Brassica napus]
MKSLVYGTLVTLLTGNSRMSFSASGLLPLRGLCSSLIHTNFSYDSFAIGVIESQGKEQLAKSNFYSIKRENIHV